MLTTQNELQYLNWIYVTQIEKKQKITPSKLVELSQTKPSSVTEMIQKLAKKDLIIYQPYHQALISDSGKKLALKNIRFERLWIAFMAQSLSLNWEELHEVSKQSPKYSKELEEKLDQKLNFPRIDPFGDVIPNNKLQIIPQHKIKLNDIKPNESFQIIGLVNKSEDLLKQLNTLGILPYSIGKVLSSNLNNFSLNVKIAKTEISIPEKLLNQIWVKKTTSEFSLF